MSLSYSYIDWKYPLAPPPFKVNGGLYTGEAAKGPWGNYPVLPEPNELAKNLLKLNLVTHSGMVWYTMVTFLFGGCHVFFFSNPSSNTRFLVARL